MVNATVAAAQEARPAGFLGLMRNRNYALLWWGQLVSEMGNRFHWVAVSLWIYSATQSASAVSLAISSMFVGGLLVSLWAGALVDRLDRKRILILTDVVRSGLVALIPLLMSVDIRLVYLDLALISIATAFFRPAIFAVLPMAVSRRDLLPANSFFSAMDTGTEIIAPAIAGVIAFRYGYAPLLYIDAGTYAVSSLCILAMSIAPTALQLSERVRAGTIWRGVVEGLQYVRRDPLQWGLFVLMFPAYLVGGGLNALQTPLAKGVVGITDVEFGTFQSVWGVGFLTASLLLGWYGIRLRKSLIIIGGYFLAFAATALMGFSRSFEILLVMGFSVGFANTLYYVGLSTVLMEHTSQEIIGRVFSTRQLVLNAMRVLSPLVFGAFADRIGVGEAIIVMAFVGALGTSIVVVRHPTIRTFDLAAPISMSHRIDNLWRAIGGPIDTDFDGFQQRRLNLLSVTAVLAGWLGLLYWVPYFALGLLIAVLSLVRVGTAVRRRGWLP